MRFVILLFLLLSASAAQAGPDDRLVILGAACVDTPEIHVNQLVRAEGEDALLVMERIGPETLMAAPRFDGARASLVGTKVREMILQRFGPGLPRIEAPDSVQVQRGGQVIDANVLRPELDKILTKALLAQGDEVNIREHRMADYFFVADATPCRIRVSPVGTVGPGRVGLRFEAVTESGKILQAFTGTVFADVWRNVPCATRVLGKGNLVEPSAVTFERRNLALLPRSVWSGQGMPLRMRSTVGEGQVIYEDNVEAIPLVEKGKVLTLVYEGRSIKLSVPVESMEDGAPGAKIKVRNKQSRKVIMAQVVDKNTVMVP